MRISFNAPVTLGLVFGSLAVLAFAMLDPGIVREYFSSPVSLRQLSVLKALSLVTYVFGHADWQHFTGNAFFILLIGPAVEEKYGSKVLVLLMLFTALLTAALSAPLFSTGLMGASGIVFMLIILNSITNVREGDIPLTFLLVLVLFLGREVVQIVRQDNISQFAHIIGGCLGGAFGLVFNRKKVNGERQTETTPQPGKAD